MTQPTGHAVPLVEPGTGFDAFYQTHFAAAVRLAHLLTGSNLAAEDLAQEGLCRMRRRFDRIDAPARYLQVTMINICRNWQRGRDREQERLAHIVPAHTPSAETDHLLALVDALPFRQRAVLVLRFWLDLSETEIAHALGCRPGTVKSLCARALARLRTELDT